MKFNSVKEYTKGLQDAGYNLTQEWQMLSRAHGEYIDVVECSDGKVGVCWIYKAYYVIELHTRTTHVKKVNYFKWAVRILISTIYLIPMCVCVYELVAANKIAVNSFYGFVAIAGLCFLFITGIGLIIWIIDKVGKHFFDFIDWLKYD